MDVLNETRENLADSVPDSVRLKWTLKRLGENESYIQELENTIKTLRLEVRNLKQMTKEERNQVKKEIAYKELKDKVKKLNHSLHKSRQDYEYIISKYNSNKL